MYGFHPVAAVTYLVLASIGLGNFFTLEWQSAPLASALGSLVLASPFFVFIGAHRNIATTWKRHAYLAAGSLLFVIPCMTFSFLLRWFQPGAIGLGVAGLILIVLALAYRFPVKFIKEE